MRPLCAIADARCIRATNGAIRGAYAVRLLPPSERPDAELWTANGAIDVRLSLLGARAARIDAHTWNGAVRLRAAREGPVTLDARSRNGAVHLWLPRGFDGILTAASGNGSVRLSPALMRLAVLVPHQGQQAWRVKAPATGGDGGGKGEGGAGGGPGAECGSSSGGRKRGEALIEISLSFGSGKQPEPQPDASSSQSRHPHLPPPAELSSPQASPFTPGDDKKALALALATADEQRERAAGDLLDQQVRDRSPVQTEEPAEVGGEKAGPDRANATTANGKVRVYLADEDEDEDCSKCLVM